MRLAIISDVHGNLVALERVLADLRRHAPDAIVNLGDCVTGPLWPRETWLRLKDATLLHVRGNHDRWLGEADKRQEKPIVAFTAGTLSDAERGELTGLPASLSIEPGILAVHGIPASDSEYLLETAEQGRLSRAPTSLVHERLGDTAAALVLCGHSHLQGMAWAGDGRLVVNPGSVGEPRYAGNPDPFAHEAGSPHARYALATSEQGAWSVAFFALAYDWAPVIARATDAGYPGWARGFSKGGASGV